MNSSARSARKATRRCKDPPAKNRYASCCFGIVGSRERRANPGFSERLEIPAAGRWQHSDHHGRSRYRRRAIPRVPPGTQSDRSERQKLALLRFAAQTLQLFLRGRVRENEKRRISRAARSRMVARFNRDDLRAKQDARERG